MTETVSFTYICSVSWSNTVTAGVKMTFGGSVEMMHLSTEFSFSESYTNGKSKSISSTVINCNKRSALRMRGWKLPKRCMDEHPIVYQHYVFQYVPVKITYESCGVQHDPVEQQNLVSNGECSFKT